ncbi:hypothetical protein AMK27_24605 [Streptomyces sp. CB02009]|nr:hypothetical protein AMK27_24605 [Streptomyces sp. CB02009]
MPPHFFVGPVEDEDEGVSYGFCMQAVALLFRLISQEQLHAFLVCVVHFPRADGLCERLASLE